MEKSVKNGVKNQLTMLKAAAEIPGQSAKGKEQRQRYTPLLFEVEKFQVSVDASNIRQPSMRVSFSRTNGCAVSCPHAVSYFNMR